MRRGLCIWGERHFSLSSCSSTWMNSERRYIRNQLYVKDISSRVASYCDYRLLVSFHFLTTTFPRSDFRFHKSAHCQRSHHRDISQICCVLSEPNQLLLTARRFIFIFLHRLGIQCGPSLTSVVSSQTIWGFSSKGGTEGEGGREENEGGSCSVSPQRNFGLHMCLLITAALNIRSGLGRGFAGQTVLFDYVYHYLQFNKSTLVSHDYPVSSGV